MIEEIKREDIPASVDGLIEFWSQKGIVERSQPEPVQADILNYLQWVGYLLGEVEQLEKEKSNVHDWREKAAREASQLRGQVEELQQIIETAVMFLQSNELHVKAEQIKAMVKKGLNHEIR